MNSSFLAFGKMNVYLLICWLQRLVPRQRILFQFAFVVMNSLYPVTQKYCEVNFLPASSLLESNGSVSYTHLTLPTICSVQISVVAVSLKKKKRDDKGKGKRERKEEDEDKKG
eukprot:TRINITY_DN17061_c0_g1_i2.p2 TRINITY_DN17061_c0_g1~~TRINITY_DN17061_c0_g1_i2.p2  ORF type:complete len:113 (+),score=16.78 TRINITY_DN17061_c0_g1_i2:103-441(+)